MEGKNTTINFIIEYTKGTVHAPRTRILGEVSAKDAETALAQCLLDPSHKKWKKSIGIKDKDYLQIYNPIGSISDSANHYTARPGELIKNNKGLVRYIVEFTEGRTINNKITKQLGQTWAKDAEAAVLKYLNPAHKDWVTDQESKNNYYIAIGNPDRTAMKMQYYTAKAVARYSGHN